MEKQQKQELGWRVSDQVDCTILHMHVQEVHTKSEVVHPTPGQLGLGVIFNTHAPIGNVLRNI